MAKFVTEDGRGGISGDKLMMELQKQCEYTEPYIVKVKRHKDVNKLKIPVGKLNRHRLCNLNMYDMLTHIQQTLSLNGRCILEMLTNEDHKCINMNDTIHQRIHYFCDKFITDEFKQEFPRIKVRFKVEGTDDEYDYRDETDEEWYDRLCHLYMHKHHPSKLQMIKCEECIQCWLNSDKW